MEQSQTNTISQQMFDALGFYTAIPTIEVKGKKMVQAKKKGYDQMFPIQEKISGRV